MITKRVKIPDDVRDYIRKKTALRILKLILLEAVILTFILFIGERVFEYFDVVPRLIIYIMLLVIPFFVTGVPFKMIDKAWEGEIIDVEIKSQYTVTKEAKGNLRGENVVWLTVRREGGNISVVKGKSYPYKVSNNDISKTIKPEHFLNEYKVGSKVYHLSGLPTLIIVKPDTQSTIDCAVCGQENDFNRKKCWSCGHTLIKFN